MLNCLDFYAVNTPYCIDRLDAAKGLFWKTITVVILQVRPVSQLHPKQRDLGMRRVIIVAATSDSTPSRVKLVVVFKSKKSNQQGFAVAIRYSKGPKKAVGKHSTITNRHYVLLYFQNACLLNVVSPNLNSHSRVEEVRILHHSSLWIGIEANRRPSTTFISNPNIACKINCSDKCFKMELLVFQAWFLPVLLVINDFLFSRGINTGEKKASFSYQMATNLNNKLSC